MLLRDDFNSEGRIFFLSSVLYLFFLCIICSLAGLCYLAPACKSYLFPAEFLSSFLSPPPVLSPTLFKPQFPQAPGPQL